MNKKQLSALRVARSLVGNVHRVTPGPTGWGYNTWDERAKLWRVNDGMTHKVAQQSCAQYVAVTAYILLAGDVEDELTLYEADTPGTTTERLRALMRRFPIESETP